MMGQQMIHMTAIRTILDIHAMSVIDNRKSPPNGGLFALLL
jgi:hypothetical protein